MLRIWGTGMSYASRKEPNPSASYDSYEDSSAEVSFAGCLCLAPPRSWQAALRNAVVLAHE